MRLVWSLLAALLLASGAAQAQSATPTVAPTKMGIDQRRNWSPNIEQPATLVVRYDVSATGTISVTAPLAKISGTTYARYAFSPISKLDYSGTLCEFAIRNNGIGTAPSAAASTDGSGWEKGRTGGWLEPGATGSTARWVALKNYSSSDCWFTVTWESMITQ